MDIVEPTSLAKRKSLGENESPYGAVYFTSVDRWLSNRPDLPEKL